MELRSLGPAIAGGLVSGGRVQRIVGFQGLKGCNDPGGSTFKPYGESWIAQRPAVRGQIHSVIVFK